MSLLLFSLRVEHIIVDCACGRGGIGHGGVVGKPGLASASTAERTGSERAAPAGLLRRACYLFHKLLPNFFMLFDIINLQVTVGKNTAERRRGTRCTLTGLTSSLPWL